MKPVSSIGAAVKLNEPAQVMKTRLQPEKPLSSLMEREDVVFAAIPFLFRYNTRFDMNVPRAKGSLSMMQSQMSMRQRLLMNRARLLLLIAPEMEEDVLKKTNAEGSLDYVGRGEASDGAFK